jgi:hypothetical protein
MTTAAQVEKWLDTDESKSVGQKDGGRESAGHVMGSHIVTLLGTKQDD